MIPANAERRSCSVPSAAPLGWEEEGGVSRRTQQEQNARVRDNPWMRDLACHLGNEAQVQHVCVGDFFICLGATNSSLPCPCLNYLSNAIPARGFLRLRIIHTSHAPPKAHPSLCGPAGPLQRAPKKPARASADYCAALLSANLNLPTSARRAPTRPSPIAKHRTTFSFRCVRRRPESACAAPGATARETHGAQHSGSTS